MSGFKLPEIDPETGLTPVISMEQIKDICIHFGLHDVWEKIKADTPIRPFRSDGPSCFPRYVDCPIATGVLKTIDLFPAAFLHDLKYWCGHKGEEVDRFLADLDLARDVVVLCGGSTFLAWAMLSAVRIGGRDDMDTSWRWGFGRP